MEKSLLPQAITPVLTHPNADKSFNVGSDSPFLSGDVGQTQSPWASHRMDIYVSWQCSGGEHLARPPSCSKGNYQLSRATALQSPYFWVISTAQRGTAPFPCLFCPFVYAVQVSGGMTPH